MKNRILLVMISCLLSLVAMAQSRSTMKKMFDEGRFHEAKPMLEKLLKKNPKKSSKKKNPLKSILLLQQFQGPTTALKISSSAHQTSLHMQPHGELQLQKSARFTILYLYTATQVSAKHIL